MSHERINLENASRRTGEKNGEKGSEKKKEERRGEAGADTGRKKIREGKNVSGMVYNGRIAREYNEILQCNSHKASETTKGRG